MIEIIQTSLLSPMVLAFVLGIVAVMGKSDLKIPDSIYVFLSIYLLLAISLKGGYALSQTSLTLIWKPILATILLGFILPIVAFSALFYLGKFRRVDSAAIAALYGSVSIVTFVASQVFVDNMKYPADGFMTALVAILEVPAIIIALLIANRKEDTLLEDSPFSLLKRSKAIIFSKSVLLLLGGLVIGYVSGSEGMKQISPLFVDPFKGFLLLFLLDMGVVTGSKLSSIKELKPFLFPFAILMPILSASIAIVLGHYAGLGVGSCTVFASMAASASYIAAPAAVRISLPTANPAYYLSAALVITFPFNLIVGIPLYYQMTLLFKGLFH